MYYKVIIIWDDREETYLYVEGDKQSKDEVRFYNDDDSVSLCYREEVTETEYKKNTQS